MPMILVAAVFFTFTSDLSSSWLDQLPPQQILLNEKISLQPKKTYHFNLEAPISFAKSKEKQIAEKPEADEDGWIYKYLDLGDTFAR